MIPNSSRTPVIPGLMEELDELYEVLKEPIDEPIDELTDFTATAADRCLDMDHPSEE